MESGVLLKQSGARREGPVATSGRTWFWRWSSAKKKCDFRLEHLRATEGSRTAAVGASRGGRCWACAATAQAQVGGIWDGRSNREGGHVGRGSWRIGSAAWRQGRQHLCIDKEVRTRDGEGLLNAFWDGSFRATGSNIQSFHATGFSGFVTECACDARRHAARRCFVQGIA